jgi:hypothetical protein
MRRKDYICGTWRFSGQDVFVLFVIVCPDPFRCLFAIINL